MNFGDDVLADFWKICTQNAVRFSFSEKFFNWKNYRYDLMSLT